MSGSLVSDSFVCCHFTFHVFSPVLMLPCLEIQQFSSHIVQFTFQHQGSYRQCVSWFQETYNFECLSVSPTCHLHSLTAFRLCEETPLLTQSECVCLCVLNCIPLRRHRLTSRATTVFELNLNLFDETSDLNFAHRSKVLSIRSFAV